MVEIIGVYVVPMMLASAAVVDCMRTPRPRVRHLPKPLWFPVIIGLYVIGPLAWLVAGRRGPGSPAGPTPVVGRSLPPDDDPEFLRWVSDEITRRRTEQ